MSLPGAETRLPGLDRNGAGRTEAMRTAGRYLGVRPRTEREVRTRLERDGHGPDVVEEVVSRLVELRLVDDEAFARAWVVERSRTRGRAGDLLVAELVAKGVPPDAAAAAVDDVAPNEEDHAVQVAARLVRKVARLPLGEQAARLREMLLRRGFSEDSAATGVKAVLPPEGWD